MSVSNYRSPIKNNTNLDEQRDVWLALLAVLCFSTAPILVIGADPLSPYEKAFWRLVVATLVVWMLALAQCQRGRVYSQRAPGARRVVWS